MTDEEKLAEAENVLHQLLMGQRVVAFTDQSGERVEYNQTSIPALRKYIAELKQRIYRDVAPILVMMG